jgi:hypothetical protein
MEKTARQGQFFSNNVIEIQKFAVYINESADHFTAMQKGVNMKRILLTILAIILCLAAFSGCSNEEPDNSTPADYFHVQKKDNGVIVFSVVAGFPQAKYTYKDAAADEYVGIALNNANGEINSLLFDLLNGRSTIADDESDAFTDCVTMTYSYTSDDGHSEITVVYEFKWSSASNTMTIFKNNTLVGTVLLPDDEMSAFKDTLKNLQ